MAKPQPEILFRFNDMDFDTKKLGSMPVQGLEDLLENVGAARERQGLLVARTSRSLDEARKLYKQLTEARNALKGFLVPGTAQEND